MTSFVASESPGQWRESPIPILKTQFGFDALNETLSRCASIVRPPESTVEDPGSNSTGGLPTFQVQDYLVDLDLKSRSQKLGSGVGCLCRVCRIFLCCIVGVCVLTADVVGEAAGVGVVVANAAGVNVIVGITAGADGITAGGCAASAAAGTCCGVGLFAIPNTIATRAEKIPTIPIPIAKRARRCVCSWRTSLCLRSISLRISDSRSEAVMISFGGSIGSDWISKK
jgi:hypothetical protein